MLLNYMRFGQLNFPLIDSYVSVIIMIKLRSKNVKKINIETRIKDNCNDCKNEKQKKEVAPQ